MDGGIGLEGVASVIFIRNGQRLTGKGSRSKPQDAQGQAQDVKMRKDTSGPFWQQRKSKSGS